MIVGVAFCYHSYTALAILSVLGVAGVILWAASHSRLMLALLIALLLGGVTLWAEEIIYRPVDWCPSCEEGREACWLCWLHWCRCGDGTAQLSGS